MAQSIVDTWMEEWLQQGIQQGIRQDQEQVIQRLLRRGDVSHKEIASLVNVGVARVQEVAENVDKGS